MIIINNSDFITKHLFIDNNKLISVGGHYVNIYDLGLDENPMTESHGKYLSGFNITRNASETYIIGGDLIEDTYNHIFKWDYKYPQNFVEFATLPVDRVRADGTIVDGKFYVFGGAPDKYKTTGTDQIFVIPMDNPENVTELKMNAPILNTFTQEYQGLIFVAGTVLKSESENIIERKPMLGVFDPKSESFQEIPLNFGGINDYYSISQMCILNDKIYMLYGYSQAATPPDVGIASEWAIYVADLN